MYRSVAHWRWLTCGALALYLLLSLLLIAQQPGLQYDEALLVLNGVHMRHSLTELPLPHDPNTWACLGKRCLPLMTVRYAGAVKDYLAAPLFAVFGTSAEAVRAVSIALGLAGIWGIARLLARQIDPRAAALSACAMAVHPAYADLTVFDNGTVAVWMGALGAVCAALSHYLSRQTPRAAFWLGAAIGLGVWARANFVWIPAAAAVAAFAVLRARAVPPRAQLLALVAGGIVGGAPLLVYQVISKGGTIEAIGMFGSPEPLAARLPNRLVMLAEVLLSDREHRAIWDGPAMPGWQRWLFPLLALGACGVCLIARRSVWPRVVALTALLLAAIGVFSGMQVAEHHLIIVVPLAAVVCVLAATICWDRGGPLRVGVCLAAAVYLASAAGWQAAAVDGLARTGGTGQWSDAINELADQLTRRYPEREIAILDWGLQNNLYVLTDARLRTRELFGNEASSDRGRPWSEEIRRGGVFVLSGRNNRFFKAPAEGFLRALESGGAKAKRFQVLEAGGAVFAEVIEILPAR